MLESPSALSRGRHSATGNRLKRHRSFHLPIALTVSSGRSLSTMPYPKGEASVQVTRIDQGRRKLPTSKGAMSEKIRHSLRAHSQTLHFGRPLPAKS